MVKFKVKFLFYFFWMVILSPAIGQKNAFQNNIPVDWNPNKLGTNQATCVSVVAPPNNNDPKGPSNNNTFNGNGTINTSYTATACGLNYTMNKVKLGKRFFPAGVNQPATINISGLPPCFQVLRAYLYTGGSGNGIAINASVTNPASTNSVFAMTQIGTHIDKCWGYTGTYNYRADITALISGNGNYVISGIPTNPPTAGNDMDGASILIIYADPTQNWTGHIVLGDGCQVAQGGSVNNTLTGFNACANANMTSCFMIISDLQNVGNTDVRFNSLTNNFVYPNGSNDWYDHIVMAAAPLVTAGQTTSNFGVTHFGDCYNIIAEGLYYRTNCNVCTSSGLTVTPVTTSTCTVGSATAIASGGSGPYTYTWMPTASNASAITNVAPGNYTVTVKDASGCFTGTALAVIPANSTTIAVNSGTICSGKSITLSAIGGNTYTWTPAASLSAANGPTVIATPSVTTQYTVTGTNSLGCTGTTVATVVVNPLPVVTVNNPTVCLNTNINLTATGGTAFAWSGPNAYTSTQQNPIINNAQMNMSGNYTVLVTSAQGCTNTAVASVSVVPLPTVSVAGTSTFCSQNFNGSPNSTNLTASGAVSYVWVLPAGYNASPNTNSNPVTITGPVTSAQAVAIVTVVGTSGSCSNSAVYTVTVIPNPTVIPAPATASICQGFSTNLTVSGASTYTWSPPTGLNTTLGPSVIASPANTTIYSVIGSSAGCNSQTQNITLNVVPNPTITVNPPNPVICLGNNIVLTAGGASNYTWSPATALSNTTGPNTTASPTITTTYQVLGEQATCTGTAAVTVTVLGLPSVTVTPSSPTMCLNNFNGSPNTIILNGSGAASYTWGPVVGANLNTTNGPSVIATSNGMNTLVTGTVIGANGTCTNMATFTLNAVANPVITVTSGSMCAGSSVNLIANGAVTYTWSPGASLNTTNGPSVIANPAVTTLYSVIGSQAGCNSQTQTGNVTVVPNPVPVITPGTPTICFGNSIVLSASGATNFTWSPNVSISATTGLNVTVNPNITTTYFVTGEQSTCTNTAAVTVTVVPLPILNIATSSPSMCMNNYNGSPNTIVINASGANSYNWIGFSGINTNTNMGPVISATAIPNNFLATGTVVGSVSTCTSSASFSVLIIPNPVISVPGSSVCSGKSVVLTASGADSYVWSPASSLNSATGSTVLASPTNTTVYSVVGSSLNCNSVTETLTVDVVPNPTLSISPFNPTICAGSTTSLMAMGATSYTWVPAATVDNPNASMVNVNPPITTLYTVIGSLNSCTSTAVRQVVVVPLPNLQATADRTVICSGDIANINANGASTYTWIPAAGVSDAHSNFVTVSPGSTTNYTLVGNNGLCTAQLQVPIIVLAKPVLNLLASPTKVCYGNTSTIFASGAQSYQWSPVNTMSLVSNNVALIQPTISTNYTVMGVNSDGTVSCVMTQEILVEVVQPIQATVSHSQSICKGETVRLQAGGSSSYQWTPEDGLSDPKIAAPYAQPLSTTIYTVFVSDGGFCKVTTTVLVEVKPVPEVYAGIDQTYNLDEPMYINAKGTGTITWISGEGIICSVCPQTQIMPQNSGCYIAQAVNEYGCKSVDELCIDVTKDHNIYIPNIFTPNDDGKNDVFMVFGTGIFDIEVSIFDRWGERLFNSDEQTKWWNGMYKGELCKNDVYVYLVRYTGLDGKKHTKTGHVTLMK